MAILLKKFTPLLIAPFFLLLSMTSKKNVDFSGEWKLNESKSDMGQYAPIVPLKIKAEQKADALVITKTSPGFDGGGEVTASETLGFDGTQVETNVAPGSSKRKASAKWSDDGQTLTITYIIMLDFNGQATEVKGTETWALSDDGKTLTTTNTSTSSFGENTYKGVYEK
jgi:hypothetical protein